MMKPRIGVIAIVARGGAIGRGGDQPFHIKEDFRHFKALTLGKPIVMGRKTFEALPGGALPGRTNIVVTRNADWSAEGVVKAASLDEALAKGGEVNAEEVMIIGGGEIYRQAMPLATNLYITEVDADVSDADTFFPEVDLSQWNVVSESESQIDPRSNASFRFLCYERNGTME